MSPRPYAYFSREQLEDYALGLEHLARTVLKCQRDILFQTREDGRTEVTGNTRPFKEAMTALIEANGELGRVVDMFLGGGHTP